MYGNGACSDVLIVCMASLVYGGSIASGITVLYSAALYGRVREMVWEVCLPGDMGTCCSIGRIWKISMYTPERC